MMGRNLKSMRGKKPLFFLFYPMVFVHCKKKILDLFCVEVTPISNRYHGKSKS